MKTEIETNKLHCGDNLAIMSELPSESIDLIYLDPPFFTQAGWTKGEHTFEDKFESMTDYTHWLHDRIVSCYRLLKPTGSIYLHLDRHAVHYAKIMMDDIFGYDNFRSDITRVTTEISGFKTQRKGWIMLHDNILYYVKSGDFIFNKQYDKHTEAYVRSQFKRRDQNGRQYEPGRENRRTRYADELKGIPMSDVWDDVKQSSLKSNGAYTYPTQKPLNLLDRIIRGSSDMDDIVLDPFCGSGTTCVAAKIIGRKYIGIDRSQTAVDLAQDRLNNIIDHERLHKWI